MIRVAHVIAEFSAREAMGRTVTEVAERVPGEHHLITTRVVDGAAAFASVHELGGRLESFPLGRSTALAGALARIRPGLVHLHAGALGPLLGLHPALRPYRKVLTAYAWPTLPGPRTWRRAGLAEMLASNVLRPRVAATSLLPARLAVAALRRSGITTVLTPDPRVARRLGGPPPPGRPGGPPLAARPGGLHVLRYACGAPLDDRRARFDPVRPVVVFAGRAETVRGLDTLLAAFPLVRARVPGARLRLLLIPRPELPAILAAAGGAGGPVEVVTDPVPDLLGEFAAAQVGAWPFKFDYTTSPPAMALVEAMAVGLPVVGTDVACVRAVLDPGVTGLAVPPAHPTALADALIRLLTDEAEWHCYETVGHIEAREQIV